MRACGPLPRRAVRCALALVLVFLVATAARGTGQGTQGSDSHAATLGLFATGTSSTPAPGTASGPPAPSAATIGVLAQGSLRNHACTASVVDSRRGTVIVTAAHCVQGSGAGLLFAPGYRAGRSPYGTWVVQAAYVSPGWRTNQDPADDLAFLTVSPSDHSSTTVQSVVGGYPLDVGLAPGADVTVTGYVTGAATSTRCTAGVYLTDAFPSFGCAGFSGGTSGSPWVVTGSDGADRVAGVIGGLHQGGCTDSTSYATAFGPAAVATLARADAASPGDIVPAVGNDC